MGSAGMQANARRCQATPPVLFSALGALALIVGLWLPTAGHAQDGTQVVVRSFEGRRAARVRAAVVEALADARSVSLVATGDVDDTASRLGVSTSDPLGRVAISRELGIDAWVEGEVGRDGKRWSATVQVSDGGNGESVETALWDARSWKALAKVIGREAREALMPAIGRTRRPGPEAETAKPEEAPVEERELDEEQPPVFRHDDEPARGDEDEDEDTGSDGARPVPLELDARIGLFSRSYEYTENLDQLPGYDLSMPPVVLLRASWYPGAHFTSGVPANIGLTGRFGMAFGLDSKGPGGAVFETSSSTWEVGVRWRIPVDVFELALTVAYGAHDFSIDPASQDGATIDPGVPAADYAYLRIGGDARMVLGDVVSVSFHGAWLPVLSTGDIEDWFPRASGVALEGGGDLGYLLDPSLEVYGGLSVRRYAVTIDPKPEDVDAGQPIAGGIIDEYLTVGVGVRWWVGGDR